MRVKLSILSIAFISLTACSKSVESIPEDITNSHMAVKEHIATALAATHQFLQYTILQGQQYCDRSTYQATKYDSLSFIVKFDSSAIYETKTTENQYDINKLFGFSDNNAQHQQFSARFGWRWSNNALRLFGYVYNNGVRSSKELGTIAIGAENSCSIKVSKSSYIFTLNGQAVTMERASTTEKAEGYKLFPYFGGDELAPHTISIWIKEL